MRVLSVGGVGVEDGVCAAKGRELREKGNWRAELRVVRRDSAEEVR
jgi:hypothetical protein